MIAIIALVFALVLALLAAYGVNAGRINLLAASFAFYIISVMIGQGLLK